MRHWHILGVGAIGGLFASLLQAGGSRCTLLLREDDPDAGESSLTVELRCKQQHSHYRFPVSARGDSSGITHLLVTTKAQDIVPALAAVIPRLSPASTVLVLANGMGYLEQLQTRWPWLPCYAGTTTEGVYRQGRRLLCHAGSGTTLIGGRGESTSPPWFADWQNLAVNCAWEPRIDQALWRKLAINCAINPLTAVHDCCNGELASRPELAVEVQQLCEEIRMIGAAAGQHQAVADLHTKVAEVIAATANNRSSMLQDIRARRTTEIDYLNGYLLTLADELKLEAPRNRALVTAVRSLQKQAQKQVGRRGRIR
ncbi:ketopantoate reductase family protein [Kineobactrum salinum]|uniref:2-dehydropantoate 2-reductase n=1 Tax=Kineobactrum salinum TaxID=2708301 RepID=A0A6C0U6S6_9GAMM|nr:2-dehydropantoate 2-reductase [Kineobactrum salinum]QIB66647.1 2-dehydropantoate 2-reductase [Kineobactrum salinum]